MMYEMYVDLWSTEVGFSCSIAGALLVRARHPGTRVFNKWAPEISIKRIDLSPSYEEGFVT